MDAYDLQGHLENLACHFNWQLDCSRSRLKQLHQDLKDRLHTGCTWMCQLHNLLGYVLHVQGSSDEALTCLRKAEKMIREKGDEEKDCLLLVNQANLAWVHYLRGELAESQAYLEEVTRLQEAPPVPSGSLVHPEFSAQKGWSLLKFERSHKKQAIECFKMALIGNPRNRLFHKGLALAMEKGYTRSEVTPEVQSIIVKNLRVAKQMYGKDICIAAMYMINSLPNSGEKEGARVEANKLVKRLVASKCLDGLNNVLYLLIYRFNEYTKVIRVAEKMLELFPDSTRAKRHLANSLRRKVFLICEETEERTALAMRAIVLYEEVNTQHSIKSSCRLAVMQAKVGNTDAADHIFQSLLDQEHLSDVEKQLLYFEYGEYLNWERQMTSEAIDMYIKAVQIPVGSYNKDKSFQRLESIVKSGRHGRCDEICVLLDLPLAARITENNI